MLPLCLLVFRRFCVRFRAVNLAIAEEFALTLAESMLYVYEKDHEHNEWSDFIPNSIRLTMDCDSCYRLRKIWIISLSDI